MENPYGSSVMDYYQAGWTPLWLPYAQKSKPKKGYTGAAAIEPDEETLFLDWMEEPGNIALKMPANVIGIDVDRDKKTGEQTGWKKFQKLCKELGALPIEVVSTSRENLADGFTAFFVVPEGVEWKSGIAGVIDIIQGGHRYQVVAPSVHDVTARQYEWRTFPDNVATPYVLEIDALPELPAAWVAYLTKPVQEVTEAPVSLWEDEEEQEPTQSLTAPQNETCATMRAILSRRTKELKALKVSRHDAAILAQWAFVCESHKGHTGLRSALRDYLNEWLKLFSESEKENRALVAEFYTGVNGAKNKQVGNAKGSCTCGASKGSNKYKAVRKNSDVRMFR